jgi:hypothetical protein
LLGRDAIKFERTRLAAQPWLGLAGILFVAAVFFPLAIGTGAIETSLLIFGPLATFALAPIAMVAFWWNDWPGSGLQPPLSGLVDTGLVIAAALVLTILGQAVVERVDLQTILLAHPGPGRPTTFPATLALGGAVFAAMLELTLVSEGWPLRGAGRLRSGAVALAFSWAVAVVAYLLVVNTDSVPAAVRAATGLRDPGGPLAAADFGAALIAVGVWQALFFIGLRGWPFRDFSPRWLRVVSGNVAVIGAGVVTYLVLHNLANWQPDSIGAVCGCLITATLIVAMLFDGWPASKLRPSHGRLLTVGLIALLTVALDRSLAAYAESLHWPKATPDDWVTTAALTFIGAGIILHVAVGRRWPLTPTSKSKTTE